MNTLEAAEARVFNLQITHDLLVAGKLNAFNHPEAYFCKQCYRQLEIESSIVPSKCPSCSEPNSIVIGHDFGFLVDKELKKVTPELLEAKMEVLKLQAVNIGDEVTVEGKSWEGWIATVVEMNELQVRVKARKRTQTYEGTVRLSRCRKIYPEA